MLVKSGGVVILGIGLLCQSNFTFAYEPPTTLGTCTAHLSSAPLSLNSLFLLGDSITNASSFKSKLKAGVRVRGMVYTGQKTVSGIGIGQAIQLLDSEINHSEIVSADILYTDLGVNNWGQAITDISSLESSVDTLIENIKAINNDILILWQEPYGHAPLVSNPNIAIGAALVADYLRAKDVAGEICLIPWSELAETNPKAYTAIKYPDGVHIWGSETIYQEIAFDYIDSLRGDYPLETQ